MNAKNIYRLLLVAVVTALGFSVVSCDDDDDLYYPGPDSYPIFSSGITVAPLGRPVIVPGEPDFRDMLACYDNVITLFNSRGEVFDYFSPAELQMYPEITQVDYNRYTVLVYTVYERSYIASYNWNLRWESDGWTNYPALYVNFYYTSQPMPPGGLCLGQAAIVVEKMWDASPLAVSYSMIPY